jgi:hypothetical protein
LFEPVVDLQIRHSSGSSVAEYDVSDSESDDMVHEIADCIPQMKSGCDDVKKSVVKERNEK